MYLIDWLIDWCFNGLYENFRPSIPRITKSGSRGSGGDCDGLQMTPLVNNVGTAHSHSNNIAGGAAAAKRESLANNHVAPSASSPSPAPSSIQSTERSHPNASNSSSSNATPNHLPGSFNLRNSKKAFEITIWHGAFFFRRKKMKKSFYGLGLFILKNEWSFRCLAFSSWTSFLSW